MKCDVNWCQEEAVYEYKVYRIGKAFHDLIVYFCEYHHRIEVNLTKKEIGER